MSTIQKAKDVAMQIRSYMKENSIGGKVAIRFELGDKHNQGLKYGAHIYISTATMESDTKEKLYEFAEQFHHRNYDENEYHEWMTLPATVTKVWIN